MQDCKETRKIAANVARLSNLLTRDRADLPHSYLKDNELREAYIAYYLPANMYKVHLPLRELSRHPAGVLRKDRLRILDLGSGPGTAILGIMDFFSGSSDKPFLEFTAVDPVEENLMEALRLFRSFKEDASADASLITAKSVIERTKSLPQGPFDIIIMSNVLSEAGHPAAGLEKIPLTPPFSKGEIRPSPLEKGGRGDLNPDYRLNLVKSVISGRLATDGSLIIIEPALRETSRELLEVRDGLLKGGLHIYSPCLMNNPCPALTNPKDWCHEDIPWDPPAAIREIDKLTGLRKDSLKFSYLVIRRDALSIRDIVRDNTFRVVSEPLVSKGKIEFYLCNAGGRRLAVRLDRDKSNLNEQFSTLKRGNIISFEGLVDEGKRLRLVKETLTHPFSVRAEE
ncbi:MAG: hypothetical protein IT393_12060 [Nitrospirae bacterium]|nr:hypothetical protein [Nitrospirota bacterium]